MTTLRLATLFARKSTDNRLLTALPVVSFAIVTALLLLVIAGARAITGMAGPNVGTYRAFTAVALALLVVPMVTLGAAAAKLASRRRDAQLSSLRLLGATSRQVAALAVAESAGGALLGAVLGTVGYAALAPLVGLISFGGERLGAQLWLPLAWLPLTWLAIGLLAASSAVLGLRAVSLTPLGVRRRARPRIARGRRAIAALVLVAVGVALLATLQALASLAGVAALLIAVFVAFGCGLLALDAVGPWYVGWRARIAVRRADDVERLLAARMVLEDPLAAWRQVSGLAVTTFVGVIAGAGLGLINLGSRGETDAATVAFFADLRTGVVLTLAIAFVMVAATVSINQAAEMLDRAPVQVSLSHLGVPPGLLAGAARRSVMLAVLAVVVGAAAVALLLVAPLLGLSVFLAPQAVLVMAACIAAGVLIVRLGASIAGALVPRLA